MNRKLIDFYRGEGTDSVGRYLVDMWKWSDPALETCHNYIQWWFPTRTPSMFNEDAPRPDEEDMILFRQDPVLRDNLLFSLSRFLKFLGIIEVDHPQTYTFDGAHYTDKRYIWREFNHNHLRITRVLESLRILGLRDQAENLLRFLETVATVSHNTLSHWRYTREWDKVLGPEKDLKYFKDLARSSDN